MVSEAIRCQDVKAVSLGFEVFDDLRQCIGRRRFEVRIVHEDAAGVAPFCFALDVLHKRLDRSGRLGRVADAHVPVEVMPTLVGRCLPKGVRTTGVVAIDAATREANERWHEAELLAHGRADFVNVGDEVGGICVYVIVVVLTRVQANLMAALPDVLDRIDVTGIAQDEPRGFDAIAVERIEYLLGMSGGPIVEGEVDDLFGGLDVVGTGARLGAILGVSRDCGCLIVRRIAGSRDTGARGGGRSDNVSCRLAGGRAGDEADNARKYDDDENGDDEQETVAGRPGIGGAPWSLALRVVASLVLLLIWLSCAS